MIEYPFHLSVKVMTRSKGHNAVAAASYRAGEKLIDSSDGNKAHDYRRRSGVMSSFIMAPRNAPAWASNRAELWSRIEKSEKRVDAQLAREMVVSLPCIDIYDHLNEKNKARRLRQFYEGLLRNYARDNFAKNGMIADIALHEPSKKHDDRHYHAHIMLTMRGINDNEEAGFGDKDRSWNDPVILESWRQSWSNTVNTCLSNKGVAGFIDHRTYAERNLDIGVTRPLGSNAHFLEKRGIATKVGDENRRVIDDNISGHKYLERLFEHSPLAPESEILSSITRAGYKDAPSVLEVLAGSGALRKLSASDTGKPCHMWSSGTKDTSNDNVRQMSKALHKRDSYALPPQIIDDIVRARNDKKVRDALDYVAKPEGFKVVEAENNGHKATFLASCVDMYKSSGYDVISVARNNNGKSKFKDAGVLKGVLTYRDMLRRFGERYSGARSKSPKVMIIDEADKLSPVQDREIFEAANKIGAKVIYIGSPANDNKRKYNSQFYYYGALSASKRLRDKFLKANVRARRISDAFSQAQILEALILQDQGSAKYLHRYDNAAKAKQKLLDAWSLKMKRRHDNRFILTSSDKDAEIFNFAIQQKRLDKRHLDKKYGTAFSVAYKSDNGTILRRDMLLYRGDKIQFKKGYKGHGIEVGARATVRISYNDYSLLEMDDGRLLKVNLRETNGFDLGYAGMVVSPKMPLDQGFIYHNKANSLDDAPLLYQNSKAPVKLFYSDNIAGSLEELSTQLLGRRHYLYDGFTDASDNTIYDNDNLDNDNELEEDNKYILTNARDNAPEN